jgi:RHS repeat-associated protein
LGHVEYVTDLDGLPYQHFYYTAWGETLLDQKATRPGMSFDSPYRFNGKELDDETGLYHYGARYYNPTVSVWLGVDPLAHKSPNQTPYHFVSNNPIMRVDPDGKKDVIHDHMGNQIGIENDNWFHNLFVGERNFITDQSGKNRFYLGEQGLSVMKSASFEGFISDWETSSLEDGLNARITAATVEYDPMKENVLDFVLRESQDKPGKLMNQKTQLNANKLYGFAGKALNVNEAGNVVWGAAMNVFGMDPFGTYFSAHGGTYILKQRLDERDEASAAMMGSFYMQRSSAGRQLKKALTKRIYGEWLQKNYGLTPR